MKRIVSLLLVLLILMGMALSGTLAFFSDTETSTGNTFTAWVEVCEPGSMVIVSDTNTMVTEVNGQSITPQNAELAWVHSNWWSSLSYNFGYPANDAQWIWETFRTDDPGDDAPVTGWVVRFERTFTIPCSPSGATLDMTVDNGYTVWINGNLVGCAQVDSGETDPCIGWETSDLTEDYVHTSNWMTVEHYTINSTDLVTGENVLVILTANEQMDGGTADNNPAGLIYWLEVEWGD